MPSPAEVMLTRNRVFRATVPSLSGASAFQRFYVTVYPKFMEIVVPLLRHLLGSCHNIQVHIFDSVDEVYVYGTLLPTSWVEP